MKGKGQRPEGAANADRDTSPSIKSGLDQHGSRVTVRIVLRQADQENISATRTEGERRTDQSVSSLSTDLHRNGHRAFTRLPDEGQHRYLLERTYR